MGDTFIRPAVVCPSLTYRIPLHTVVNKPERPVHQNHLIDIYMLSPPMALQPNAGHGLLILDEVFSSHTTTHHSR
jgi:hypothetical protein